LIADLRVADVTVDAGFLCDGAAVLISDKRYDMQGGFVIDPTTHP